MSTDLALFAVIPAMFAAIVVAIIHALRPPPPPPPPPPKHLGVLGSEYVSEHVTELGELALIFTAIIVLAVKFRRELMTYIAAARLRLYTIFTQARAAAGR
jgi:hypothetical protein